MKTNNKLSDEACLNLKRVRETAPLVHHITNWVTISECADIVKLLGASPVMAHAKEEAADMAGLASSLVLNIGTLTRSIIDSMIAAAKAANKKGIPVTLDVCGAGATTFRNEMCSKIIGRCRIDIIKGNSSEIANIAGEKIITRGVDSTEVNRDLVEIAGSLAASNSCTVVITGARDIVSGSGKTYFVHNGHEIMSRVVGTGCMAASVIGTFAAAADNGDYAKSSACGLACYCIAAEIAAVKYSSCPGSFRNALLDTISILKESQIKKTAKIEGL